MIEFESAWGAQHSGVLENFAATILDGTPLLAPGSDGISGVRLANAIHLSSWTGTEVSLDFDEDVFLAELNKRIAEEGTFPERSSHLPPPNWVAASVVETRQNDTCCDLVGLFPR